jgi:AcrR family transcriptional regulator
MARAGLTVDSVTVAAACLADEVGFDGVTVALLARRLGVRDPSLYAHIRNIAELRVRLAALALAELADAAADASAGRSGLDALVAFASAYREYARRHPGRYAAARSPFASPEVDELVVSAARRNAALSRAVLRGYDLPEPAATDAVRLLGAVVHGYVDQEAAGGFGHHERDVDASWSAALRALDVALRAWPSTT